VLPALLAAAAGRPARQRPPSQPTPPSRPVAGSAAG
jgi:hypothetical protein